MTDAREPAPDRPAKSNSRLRQFMRRAAPIIAAEQGWTAGTHIKLRSLATDLHLPDDLYEQAIQELQASGADLGAHLNRWERDFVKLLQSELRKVPRGIMSISMENKAVQIGESKFQLPSFRARELIHQVADQMNVGRISQTEAERHVEHSIVDRIGAATFISDATRDRLYAAGRQWGIAENRVDAIILHVLSANRQRAQPGRRPWLPVTLLVAAVLAVLLLVIWLISRPSGESSPDSPRAGGKAATDAVPSPPAWWPEKVALQLNRARVNDSFINAIWDRICAPDPQRRKAGYQQLLASLVQASGTQAEERSAAFALLMQHEPDDQVFTSAVEEARQNVALPDGRLPVEENQYRRSKTACLMLWQLWNGLEAHPDRRRLVSSQLASATGIGPDEESFVQRAGAALTREHWTHLITHAHADPRRAAEQMHTLLSLSDSLEGATLLDYQRRAAQAILESDPSVWRHIERALTDVIDRVPRDTLFELVDLAELTSDLSLSGWLAAKLADRMQISAQITNRAERLKAVRLQLQGFDAAVVVDRAARWNQYQQLAQDFLQQWDGHLLPPATAHRIATVAYLGTLAMTANSGLAGQNPFDEQLQKGAPDLDQLWRLLNPGSSSSDFGKVQGRSTPNEQRTMDAALQSLAQFGQQSTDANVRALSRLGNVAPRFADITADQGIALARYFLSPHSEEESVAVQQAIVRMRHWLQLWLGLADAIPASDCSRDQAQMMAELLVQGQVEVEESNQWKSALSVELMTRISERLKQMVASTDPSPTESWNALRHGLLQQYRARAIAAGASPADAYSAERLSDLMLLVASRYDPDGIAARAGVLDLLAADEMQRCALAGEQLVHRIAAQIVQQRPESSEQVKAIISQVEPPQSLAQQLLANELIQLKLWDWLGNAPR